MIIFLLLCFALANGLPTLEVAPEETLTDKRPHIEAGTLPDLSQLDPYPTEVVEKLKEECRNGKCLVQDESSVATKKFVRDHLIAQQQNYGRKVDTAAIDRQLQKTFQLKQEILNKKGIGDFIAAADDGLFEGDLIMNEEQLDEMLQNVSPQPFKNKAGVAMFLDNPDLEKYKWNARETIYYTSNNYLHLLMNKGDIHAVFAHLMDKVPCLRFEFIESGDNLNQPYLMILPGNSGVCCVAHLGKQQLVGPTTIRVGDGKECGTYFQNLLHNVLHTLGVLHMQQRFDRDKFITVLPQNLGKYAPDFVLKNSTQEYSTYGTKYDFRSVMHARVVYRPSERYPSDPRFEIKDPKIDGTSVGFNEKLSDQDILLLKEMYCPNPKCANDIDLRACQTLFKRGNCNVKLVKRLCRRTCNLC